MNYFAHGRAYLDRPYFLAGTAVPDWLNVSDRGARVRRKQAEVRCRAADGEGAVQAVDSTALLEKPAVAPERGSGASRRHYGTAKQASSGTRAEGEGAVQAVDSTALLGKPAVAPHVEASKARLGTGTGKITVAPDGVTAEVAAGIVRHLDDDAWFHRSAAFYETTSRLARAVGEHLADEPAARPGFVGHVLTEVLLDAALIERDPALLDAYYEAIGRVDAARVQQAVNAMAARPAERLAVFIRMFREEQFLRCYLDDQRLTWRMNQVMRRVGLPPLPCAVAEALPDMRGWVRERADDLLDDGEVTSDES
jgi:hypothetical protein